MKNKKCRDVLFLCQYFYPEHNSSATLPFDTACALAASGMTVDALCGMPHEYSDARHVPARETVFGVSIRRVRYLHPSRRSRFGRLFNFFSFTVSVLLHLGELRHHRVVIVYSNPPILPIVSYLANRLFGTKIIFVAYDIYPEIALAVGSIRPDGFIDCFMRRIKRLLFQRVSRVVALTDEMKEKLLYLNPDCLPERIVTIPNWAHEQPNAFADDGHRPFGFAQDDFIVSYFGNMGVCQEMETLLGAINELRGSEVHFLLAGHGSKLEEIRARTADNPNVHICGFLEGREFSLMLAASSCCVVTLEPGLSGLCAPSKYYSYLQAGRAVLSVTDPESYLAKEIKSEHIGIAVNCGDIESLADAIRNLRQDPENCGAMGVRAHALYTQRYEKNLGTDAYTALCRTVMAEETVQ